MNCRLRSEVRSAWRHCVIAALLAFAALLAAAPAALAAEGPKPLWQRCDGSAGDLSCGIPRGIGVSPTSGHLYVADQENFRIDEYTAWGEFVRAWGWGVLNGAEELQVCTTASACQSGIAGGGRGQLTEPQGVAVDAAGNVYVVEGDDLGTHHRRVQKFDSEGHFIVMFGAKVNKTKVEEGKPAAEQNRCPVDPADVCQAAVEGSGPGEFGPLVAGSFIATGPSPNNLVYVGDKGRVQVFNPNGTYKEDFPDPEGIIAAGGAVKALAAAPSGGLYLAFKEKPDVTRLTSAGKVSVSPGCVAKVANPTALAMAANASGTPTGNLYVFDGTAIEVRQFSAACADKEAPFAKGDVSNSTGLAAGAACLSGADVYLSNSLFGQGYVRAYGPAPSKPACPKPLYPPEILAQYATSVGTVEAKLGTQVNPRFYADTTFQLQYATAACIEGGGWEAPCVKTKPPAPASLGAEAVDFPHTSPLVEIDGLTPATAYRYRFVAQSAGGGPVEGSERSFATFPPPSPQAACLNEAFRTGGAALLPDCRAYELVSPLDKEGGEILTLKMTFGRPAALDRSASSGDRFTYSSYTPFAGPKSAPFTSQYIAGREAGAGWSSEAISPPRGTNFVPSGQVTTFPGSEGEYEAFSADLCSGWLLNDSTTGPVLGPGGVAFNRNYYRRDNCGAGAGSYVGLSRATAGVGTVRLQGVSADGRKIAFRTDTHLSQAEATAVGTKLNCQAATAAAVSYQWIADGAPIGGATAPEYTAQPADVGKAIQCRLRASAGGGTVADATPAFVIEPYPATAPPEAPQSIPAPSASEPLEVGGAGGQTLACDPNAAAWGGSPGFAYQWYRNGVALVGASEAEYTLQAADLASAATFQCEALGENAGGTVAAMSEAIATTPGPVAPAARVGMATGLVNLGDLAVYETDGEGGVEAVCVLPSGLQSDTCTLGTANLTNGPTSATVWGALSDDGSRAFWTSSVDNGEGPIYARIDGEETVAVSAAAGVEAARFWLAAADGSAAIISRAGKLYEVDLSEPGAPVGTLIAEGFRGVVGWSEDASLIYFASTEVLTGAEVNGEGDVAQAGQPNLYLRERDGGGEALRFLGTLAGADIPSLANAGQTGLSPVAVEPYEHAARTSADGTHLAFMSRASLTGYDNRDAASGEADAEVFVYDAGSGKLACASCNPSGGRPAGQVVVFTIGSIPLATAAQLPPIGSQLYASHVLAEDGSRLFFESVDPLALGDTNGKIDVYEWEAPGAGTCDQAAPGYSPQNEGCVSLLSSGKSPVDTSLLDASPSGRDVFFTTGAGLLPYDPGSVDVYDAREGGGLPPPPGATPPCEGEACQSPPAPPAALTPASAAFEGAVNPRASKPCGKGRRRVVQKGKARCLKAHHHKRGARNHRRAAR